MIKNFSLIDKRKKDCSLVFFEFVASYKPSSCFTTMVVIFRHERSDGRPSPQARLENGGDMRISKTQNKRKKFYVKTLNWEKHGEEEKLHYNSQVTKIIGIWKECTEFEFLRSNLFFVGWRSLFILHWAVGLEVDDCEWNFLVSHIVTTTINGAGLLGLHAENSTSIHNCSYCEALHVMNVEDDWAA